MCYNCYFTPNHFGTLNYTQTVNGNGVDGALTESHSGTDRYDLLPAFNNPGHAGGAPVPRDGQGLGEGVHPRLRSFASTLDPFSKMTPPGRRVSPGWESGGGQA